MKLNGGGSVFESFRELATSTKAAGNTAPRPRKGSPYYTVIIANKYERLSFAAKKKNKERKNSKSHAQLPSQIALIFLLKKKKKRMMNLKIVQNIVRVVTIDKSAISFNGKSYL